MSVIFCALLKPRSLIATMRYRLAFGVLLILEEVLLLLFFYHCLQV